MNNELAEMYLELAFQSMEHEQLPEKITWEFDDGRRVVYELIEVEE